MAIYVRNSFHQLSSTNPLQAQNASPHHFQNMAGIQPTPTNRAINPNALQSPLHTRSARSLLNTLTNRTEYLALTFPVMMCYNGTYKILVLALEEQSFTQLIVDIDGAWGLGRIFDLTVHWYDSPAWPGRLDAGNMLHVLRLLKARGSIDWIVPRFTGNAAGVVDWAGAADGADRADGSDGTDDTDRANGADGGDGGDGGDGEDGEDGADSANGEDGANMVDDA